MEEGLRALDAKDKEIQLCNLGLSKAQDNNLALKTQVDEKDAALSSWIRNPFVMFSIGALTAIAVGALRK